MEKMISFETVPRIEEMKDSSGGVNSTTKHLIYWEELL
jgi:hypothetical protein